MRDVVDLTDSAAGGGGEGGGDAAPQARGAPAKRKAEGGGGGGEQAQAQAGAGAGGANHWLAELAHLREARRKHSRANADADRDSGAGASAAVSATPTPTPAPTGISVLTYNVWFDDAGLPARMRALSALILAERPHVLCLQEVTPAAYEVFAASPWWSMYTGSYQALRTHPWPVKAYAEDLFVRKDTSSNVRFARTAFPASIMGRELVTCRFRCTPHPHVTPVDVVAATSHLESPTPPHGFHVAERQSQLARALRDVESLASADRAPLAFFAGDLNWSETRGKTQGDGTIVLPSDRWRDAWTAANGTDDPGYTYDSAANPALKGYLKGRLDRCIVRIAQDAPWCVASAALIGKEVVPDAKRPFVPRGKNPGPPEQLPMTISDHWGLHVTLGRG